MAVTLKELAERIGGEVVGDGDALIERVASIDTAGAGDITFISNQKYIPFVRSTRATAIIVSPQFRSLQRNLVVMLNPYLGFARAVGVLMARPLPRTPGVHPSAIVAPGVQIDPDASIGARVTIEEGSRIAAGVTVMAGAYVGPDVFIDEGTTIFPNVTLYHGTRIGKRCAIHANVSIGSDGFGWAPDGTHFVPIPQVGRAIIGDDVSVGAGSIINRGGLGDTIIGNGTKIDSLVMISHNVEIGADCLFVSQVGISGTVKIGHHVTLGGQVGVAGHLSIGDNVQIAAQSGVSHSLESGGTYFGSPARPIKEMKRTVAALNKLPELRDEIRHVQKRMTEITAMLGKDLGEAAKQR